MRREAPDTGALGGEMIARPDQSIVSVHETSKGKARRVYHRPYGGELQSIPQQRVPGSRHNPMAEPPPVSLYTPLATPGVVPETVRPAWRADTISFNHEPFLARSRIRPRIDY